MKVSKKESPFAYGRVKARVLSVKRYI